MFGILLRVSSIFGALRLRGGSSLLLYLFLSTRLWPLFYCRALDRSWCFHFCFRRQHGLPRFFIRHTTIFVFDASFANFCRTLTSATTTGLFCLICHPSHWLLYRYGQPSKWWRDATNRTSIAFFFRFNIFSWSDLGFRSPIVTTW